MVDHGRQWWLVLALQPSGQAPAAAPEPAGAGAAAPRASGRVLLLRAPPPPPSPLLLLLLLLLLPGGLTPLIRCPISASPAHPGLQDCGQRGERARAAQGQRCTLL